MYLFSGLWVATDGYNKFLDLDMRLFVRIIHLLVFEASFLKFMLVETWILIVVNCFANREYFDFLGRIAKICL